MKKWLQCLVVGGIFFLGFVVVLFISKESTERRNELQHAYLEAGMKTVDLEWLIREGKISEEELKKIEKSTVGGVSIQEYNEILDSILEGKKDEFLEEQQRFIQLIPSDN